MTEGQPTTLPAGALEVCVQFGSLDDNLAPILEEIEFYQITLTTDDSADVLAERSLADFFIEDNDGKVLLNMYVSIRMTKIAHFIIYQHLAMYVYIYVNAEQGNKASLLFLPTGATIAIVMPTITIVEDMTPIDVCIVLRDIQSGLMRELRYTLTVNLGTACMSVKFFWHVHACVSSYQAKSFLNEQQCA